MASIEERLASIEQENAVLKKSDELQTIALRALVTKDAFEALRDTNNKIFDVLMSHNQLTNERLGDLQTQVIELDGKIVGLQAEMRQRFEQQQTAIGARFEQQDKQIADVRGESTIQGQKLDQVLLLLDMLIPK